MWRKTAYLASKLIHFIHTRNIYFSKCSFFCKFAEVFNQHTPIMNMFSMIIDSILSYIRRNPLTVTIVIMLAIFAPSLFGAALIGLLIGALILLIGPLIMLWRVMRQMRRVERDAQSRNSQQGFGGFRGFYTNFDGNTGGASGFGNAGGFNGSAGQSSGGRAKRNPNEGEVKIYTTSEQPQKRVSESVGDYVEFEEVKPKK